MTEIKTSTAIAEDAMRGLSSTPKYLPSKYFYDEAGSRIFQDIMHMPEYYLTACEFEIFDQQKQMILNAFNQMNGSFDLLELGAGDGYKTKVLLNYFLSRNINFTYMPVDISVDALTEMTNNLKDELPELQLEAKAGDYFEIIKYINSHDSSTKIILFLGSNIGNYSWEDSLTFFSQLRKQMQNHDQLFIGFDLKKDPQIILDAYHDPHGHTREFNLNLLRRLNRELGANFHTGNFRHHAVYEPISGTAKSYLVSLNKQQVDIDELETTINFDAFEAIYMEMSQKYDLKMINELASASGFEVQQNFFDSQQYFVNSLWKLK